MNAVNQARYVERQMATDPDGFRERRREVSRRYQARNREKRRESQRRWQAENPEKHRAHARVAHAIEAGLLVRPSACERCGTETKPEASHDDYDRPLVVEWLCRPCHAAKDSRRND